MLYSLHDYLMRKWFNLNCRGILKTPPIKSSNSTVRIVSMVSRKDLIMYLCAVKSFIKFFRKGQIIVLNDGTLTSEDKKIISKHLLPLDIIDIKNINIGRCPKGGCWERLNYIADCSKNNYTIQLDSDTLTINMIPEVISAITHNRSFILGTKLGTKIQPIENIIMKMKGNKSNHVQIMTEKNFDKLQGYKKLKYVRGCAGFSGFAKGSFCRKSLEDFSSEMEKNIGESWNYWGSEQVASNFIISNSDNALVLPYPKYSEYLPNRELDKNAFIHFIGSYRWKKNNFPKQAKKIIRYLFTMC